MKNQLKKIQNENGGGLSFEVTGKYTSVRHALAKEAGKLTAGEAAKLLTKALTEKVLAKQVIALHRELTGSSPEWHHAGFYKADGKSTMSRTFFFTEDQVDAILENYASLKEQILKKEVEAEEKKQAALASKVKGFYYFWSHDYSGRYGKKVNHKALAVYEGNEHEKPSNFTTCSDAEFEFAKEVVGRKYYGWEEPKRNDFSEEKYEAHKQQLAATAKRNAEIEAEQIAAAEEREKRKELAFEALNDLRTTFDDAGVDYKQKNSAWYIYSKFFEGKPEQNKVSCGLINSWIAEHLKKSN